MLWGLREKNPQLPDYVHSLLRIYRLHYLLKTFDTCFKVFDDLFSKHIRIGEVVQICQAFVSDPEDVQTLFVTGDDIFIGKFVPPAVGIIFQLPIGVGPRELIDIYELTLQK